MPTLGEARTALADAVTGAGLACLPYPPDTLAPPIAFVDDATLDFSGGFGGGGSFCLPGVAAMSIIAVAQRNDRAGSMTFLEGLIGPVLDALYAIQGVRVVAANSGQSQIGGVDLPAVTFAVSFHI